MQLIRVASLFYMWSLAPANPTLLRSRFHAPERNESRSKSSNSSPGEAPQRSPAHASSRPFLVATVGMDVLVGWHLVSMDPCLHVLITLQGNEDCFPIRSDVGFPHGPRFNSLILHSQLGNVTSPLHEEVWASRSGLPPCEAKRLSFYPGCSSSAIKCDPCLVGTAEWAGGDNKKKILGSILLLGDAGKHGLFAQLSSPNGEKCWVLEKEVNVILGSRTRSQDHVTFVYEFMMLRKHFHAGTHRTLKPSSQD